MVQTYILNDNGLDPMLNNKLGNDYSICGNCKHRGEALTPAHPDYGKYKMAKGRTCYVALVPRRFDRLETLPKRRYPTAQGHAAIAALGAGRMVRIGTYGDGAAVPSYIWDSLLSEADGHTGYSHQSDLVEVDPMLYMISADTETQARQSLARRQADIPRHSKNR